MDFLSRMRVPEFQLGDFLVPWGMVISVLGFITAWLVMVIMERFGLTRRIWHLPLFFVALALLFGCLIGLALAP